MSKFLHKIFITFPCWLLQLYFCFERLYIFSLCQPKVVHLDKKSSSVIINWKDIGEQMFETRHWSTAQAPDGNKVEFWKDVICEAVFELDFSLTSQSNFRASINQRSLGPIGMSAMETLGQQTVRRTPRAIARSGYAQFEFVTIQEGQMFLEHCGHDVVINAGDSVLIDSRRPYDFSTAGQLRNLSFHIPVPWLQRWTATPEKMVARPIRKETPWGKAILAMIRTMPPHTRDVWPANIHLYADQLAGALTLALTEEGATSTGSTMQIYQRAMDFLHENAHDSDLDATMLANMLQISVRYMHKIFASKGTTYSTELLGVRLELAARMLGDSHFSDLPVAEIAWRAGFRDPSHFSRRFRERFAKTPGSFRAS